MPRGSIRPKGNGWEVRVSTGRGLDGKHRQKSRYVTGTRQDAERALAQLRLTIGATSASGNTTVDDLLTAWLPTAKRDLSPTTYERYEQIARLHLIPALGPTPIHKLTPPRLDRLFADLVGTKPLSTTTVRQVKAVLHKALNEAVRWGWISTNPATLSRVPRVEKHEIDPPSTAGVGRLLEQARSYDDDLADFLHVAAVTGARRGELAGLQWADVDADRGVVTIRRAVIETKTGLVVKDTKTHQSRRVALDAGTLALLATRELRCKERAFAVGRRLGPWVFGADVDHREAIPPGRITSRFSNLRKAVGLPNVRLHDLRHYAATMLIDGGVPVPVVSKRLGHGNASTTINIYAHAIEHGDRAAADLLGNAFTRQA